MITHKTQLIRLTAETNAILGSRADRGTAKVLSLTYLHQPEGERGVQIDRELGGSCWWCEWHIEAAQDEVNPLQANP